MPKLFLTAITLWIFSLANSQTDSVLVKLIHGSNRKEIQDPFIIDNIDYFTIDIRDPERKSNQIIITTTEFSSITNKSFFISV